MNGTNFNFDLNSALIIVGVLVILYFLKLIMNNQERIIKKLNKKTENINDFAVTQTSKEFNFDDSLKKGNTKGETEISGDIDDETLAVIMASVSQYSKIPLKSLKIKYIKKL